MKEILYKLIEILYKLICIFVNLYFVVLTIFEALTAFYRFFEKRNFF